MKHTLIVILTPIFVFFVALFAYTKLTGPIPFAVNQVTTNKTDTFMVTGTGKATVTPDIAWVRVGIVAKNSSVKLAQSDMNRVINTITDAIKKTGVDAKDIQTANYSINPEYDYKQSPARIIGYEASTNLTIKVKDIDKVNSVIDTATANGATNVGGITFDVEDKTRAQNEARMKAAEEAKKKAENAANIAGFTLGRIVNYQESFNGDRVMSEKALPMAAFGGGADSSVTNIQPGSADIEVTVTLSYEIR